MPASGPANTPMGVHGSSRGAAYVDADPDGEHGGVFRSRRSRANRAISREDEAPHDRRAPVRPIPADRQHREHRGRGRRGGHRPRPIEPQDERRQEADYRIGRQPPRRGRHPTGPRGPARRLRWASRRRAGGSSSAGHGIGEPRHQSRVTGSGSLEARLRSAAAAHAPVPHVLGVNRMISTRRPGPLEGPASGEGSRGTWVPKPTAATFRELNQPIESIEARLGQVVPNRVCLFLRENLGQVGVAAVVAERGDDDLGLRALLPLEPRGDLVEQLPPARRPRARRSGLEERVGVERPALAVGAGLEEDAPSRS